MNNININSQHSNAKRAAFFINNVKHELEEKALDWKSLKFSEFVEDGYRFESKSENYLAITVLLCDSYFDATKIGMENFTSVPTARWTVNGDLLFYVESPDSKQIENLLGFFAGEE